MQILTVRRHWWIDVIYFQNWTRRYGDDAINLKPISVKSFGEQQLTCQI